MTTLHTQFERPAPAAHPDRIREVALGYRRGFLVRHVSQQWATRRLLVDIATRHGCILTEIVDQPPYERVGVGFDRLLWLAARIDGLHAIVTPSWRHLADKEDEALDIIDWVQTQARVPLHCGGQP